MPWVGPELSSPFVKCQGVPKYTNDTIRSREREVASEKPA